MEMRYAYNREIATSTYPLDATTTAVIKENPQEILGKAVALTGTTTPVVGYGKSGDRVKGIVISVEKEYSNSDTMVVGVCWLGQFSVATTSGAEKAVVGAGLAVNGSGSVITSATLVNAVCEAVDGTECIITLG